MPHPPVSSSSAAVRVNRYELNRPCRRRSSTPRRTSLLSAIRAAAGVIPNSRSRFSNAVADSQALLRSV
jgi:hypothetical protein